VLPVRYEHHLHIKSKAISVSGREGLWGCGMFSIRYCLDNRLTDGLEVDSLAHRPAALYSFLWTQSGHYDQIAACRIRLIEEFADLVRTGSRELPACNIPAMSFVAACHKTEESVEMWPPV
jgi:hypothetical protein